MSDPLILRLRNPVYLAVEPILDQPLALDAMKKAADRIEALEAAHLARTGAGEMSELAERLRFNAYWGIPDFTNKQLLNEAAARIEALEAALREIKDQYLTPDQSSVIARAALAPEQDK